MGSSITLTLILATVFQKCLQVPLGIKMDQQTSLPYNMASNIDHACYLEGNRYESGHSIPRSHPCHYCSCVRGYIDCYWQKCPPSPVGCIELNYDGVCNPSLYLCPIPDHNQTFPMKYTLKRDGQKYKTEEEQNAPDCVILSVPYRRGETIGVASNSCLECRCANGSMFCSPKCCFQPTGPEENSFLVSRSGRRSWVPVVEHPLAYLREYFKQ
ncbi:kielin/chordin-like protein isoform X1 [Limulus polyphemus]|uniref:Kielin/chordin-like protein isoform X1 n=1 Tax=Limulus polyphemus TaxID=6850 RepID=A0ABM1T3V8_LIMPO|nr:kielin/chordin-like protein isoform X1 [Limulus polyphemus]XP_022250559.1 kielin/chordin-like protein isoform X1 [Limulus polyphemus]XP_022250564.1 kielin/chordin-like protein isoform X1 [Limulus polyphemus]XP_022250570.1 kielin/chordin-like protein isoform X1 [Limulus polyphemus]XP_022250574.1 kielin/chordin-like protein isoform X1 [Limulus polyphemus]